MKKPVDLQIFQVKNLALNTTNELDLNGFQLHLYHGESDPRTANRIRVRNRETELEFLPSKGLSLAQAWIRGQQIFWEAPVGLCDTESLDLWSSEISINGHPAPGFTFLKKYSVRRVRLLYQTKILLILSKKSWLARDLETTSAIFTISTNLSE